MNFKRIISFILSIIFVLSIFPTNIIMADENTPIGIEPNRVIIGNTYYVSNSSGNDDNNGLSESTAWKSLEKVNSTTFNAGDKILFHDESVWSGQLWPKGSGMENNPIKIGKYGNSPTDQKPIIKGEGLIVGDDIHPELKKYNAAVLFHNQQYWEIEDLEITNFSDEKSTFQTYNSKSEVITKTDIIPSKYGILIVGENAGTLKHMYVRNCNVHNVNADKNDNRGAGIGRGAIIYIIRGNKVETRWDDIIIENNKIGPNITHYGINFLSTWGGSNFPHESGIGNNEGGGKRINSTNLIMRNNYCVDVGNAAISPSVYENAIIEYNISDKCNSGLNGNVPIWWQIGDYTLVQYNEVFGTGAGAQREDSQAFDGDLTATYNVVQYNYTHDNPSGSYFECALGTVYETHYRYNISQNDGSGTNSHDGGAIITSGGYSNNKNSKLYVYNNDLLIGKDHLGYIATNWDGNNLTKGNYIFENNLIYSDGNSRGWQSEIKNASIFDNNVYSGDKVDKILIDNTIDKNGKVISKELLGFSNIDTIVNRDMNEATGFKKINDYKKSDSSALKNAGKTLKNNGGRDIYGNKVSLFGKPTVGSHEIASVENLQEGFAEYNFEDGNLTKEIDFEDSNFALYNDGKNTNEITYNSKLKEATIKIKIPKGTIPYGFSVRNENASIIKLNWKNETKKIYPSSSKNFFETNFQTSSSTDEILYMVIKNPFGISSLAFDDFIFKSASVDNILENIALNKTATDNLPINNSNPASNANDGSTTTFSGNTPNPYTWEVDLGNLYSIHHVELEWEDLKDGVTNIAEDWKYKIQYFSVEGTWKDLIDYSSNNPYKDPETSVLQKISMGFNKASKLRVSLIGKPTNRSGAWYIIPEFRAFGELASKKVENVAIGKTASQNNGANSPKLAIDDNIKTFSGNTPNAYTFNLDLESEYSINSVEIEWENLFDINKDLAEDWKYSIEYSTDNVTWQNLVDYSVHNPNKDPKISNVQNFHMENNFARYFRIIVSGKPTSKSSAWYAIPEFRVFGINKNETYPNVAIGKKSTQNEGLNSADKGNDDNIKSWSGNTNKFPYIWEVDLGANYEILKSEIEWENLIGSYNPNGTVKDKDEDILEDWKYKIEYSVDNTNWNTLVDYTSTNNPVSDLATAFIQSFNLPDNTIVRYFRVSITGRPSLRPTAWAVLPEFRAFGFKVGGEVIINDGIDYKNIAYGKPIITSADDITVENITDGLSETFYKTKSSNETFKIDLGEEYDISLAKLQFINDISHKYKVYTSTNDIDYTLSFDRSSNSESATILENSMDVIGRYLKIEFFDNVSEIVDVKFYGEVLEGEQKNIMIIVPHPDDEALMTSGVIKSALERNNKVTVVISTNGDFNGKSSGEKRMRESISAMENLGLNSENLVFLSYPDTGGLEEFGQNYTDSTTYKMFNDLSGVENFSSKFGATETYNGVMNSYHYIKTGSQASYTRNNFLGDIESLISDIMPDEIYTTSRFDLHADHAYLELFVNEAILNVKKINKDINYSPKLLTGMVHSLEGDRNWPKLSKDNTGLNPFTRINGFDEGTLFDWNKRISLTVPKSLQDLPFDYNLKNNTLKKYSSQYDDKYIMSFSKFDEIFWDKNYNSLSYFADITASADSIKNPASKVADGIIDGYSTSLKSGGRPTKIDRFPFAEWIGDSSSENWINLKFDKYYKINKVILYDRPSTSDNILKGKLVFSDGSEIQVGALSNLGKPYVIEFEEKNINSVKFFIESFEGTPGLAEFEVFGTMGESLDRDVTIEYIDVYNGLISSKIINSKISEKILIDSSLKDLPLDTLDLEKYTFLKVEPDSESFTVDFDLIKNKIKVYYVKKSDWDGITIEIEHKAIYGNKEKVINFDKNPERILLPSDYQSDEYVYDIVNNDFINSMGAIGYDLFTDINDPSLKISLIPYKYDIASPTSIPIEKVHKLVIKYIPKKVSYSIQYVDKDTNNILEEAIISDVYVGESINDPEVKTFKGYNYLSTFKSSSDVKLVSNSIIVYYTKQSDWDGITVEISHKAIYGNEERIINFNNNPERILLPSDYQSDEYIYDITSNDVVKSIRSLGYDLLTNINDPNLTISLIPYKHDASITASSEKVHKVIIKYFPKKVSYSIQYIDKDTDNILEEVIVSDAYVGELINNPEIKTFKGYNYLSTFKSSSDVKFDSNEIKVYYTKEFIDYPSKKPILFEGNFTFDKRIAENKFVFINYNDNTLLDIKINGMVLQKNTDYIIMSDGVIITKNFLNSLTTGNYKVVYEFEKGEYLEQIVTIISTSAPSNGNSSGGNNYYNNNTNKDQNSLSNITEKKSDVDLGNPTLPLGNPKIDNGYLISKLYNVKLSKNPSIRFLSGFEDNTFRPNDYLTRSQFFNILYLLLDETERNNFNPKIELSDVKSTDWFYKPVMYFYEKGILKGYKDGSINPNSPITRAEVSRILSLLFEEVTFETYGVSFSDIENHWAKESIQKLASLGYLSGYKDGTFNPNGNITRAEFTSLMNRILERVPDKNNFKAEDTIYVDLDSSFWAYYDILSSSKK